MTPLETAVNDAVRLVMTEYGPMPPDALHAALWPYVRAAAAPYAERPVSPAPGAPRDRRVRLWQYTVRFWDAAAELAAETDPEQMEGTGGIPEILATLAKQLHGDVPADLMPEVTKTRLPQMRNNLGRYGKAALRVPYEFAGETFVCQMDIHRLEG